MLIGDVLGSYRVLGLMDQGGMAAICLGEHVVVRRRVAIKIIHPRHLADPRMMQRFLNEATALAALRHPGIVELYDFGTSVDGRAYIVMELLKGQTLATRLVKGPLSPRRVVAFARQIASALAAVHARGIVHRDLTPANLFLVRDAEVPCGERVKILDFGIAKHMAARGEQNLTRTGVVVGTPEHMSPEQCRGDELDGRSDVYALGLLVYHMATGRLPFGYGSTGELVDRHLYEECRPATSAHLDVPVELSDVIARCMAKEPTERFQTMELVARAFHDVAQAMELGASSTALRNVTELPASSPTSRRTRSGSPTSSTCEATLVRPNQSRPTWSQRVRVASRAFALAGITGAVAMVSGPRSVPDVDATRTGEVVETRAITPPASDNQCTTGTATAPPPVTTDARASTPRHVDRASANDARSKHGRGSERAPARKPEGRKGRTPPVSRVTHGR